MTILEDVRSFCGVDTGNETFDDELLPIIASGLQTIKDIGIDAFGGLTIDGALDWPALTYDTTLVSAIKHLLMIFVRNQFDVTASETIEKSRRETYYNHLAGVILAVDMVNRPEEEEV